MTAPSSPAPSSGSDDFAALLDAELQSSLEELEELAAEEYVDIADGEDEEEADGAEDSSGELEKGDDGEVEELGEDLDTESAAQLGKDTLVRGKFEGLEEFGSRKRKREQEENDAKPDSKTGECPPHPGFMWGVCIRCGENRQVSNTEREPVGVSLRYIHEGLEVTEREAARMRQDELKHVMVKQKLYLVLDLDHTLLNSARFMEVFPEEEAHLAACYSKDSAAKPTTGSQMGGAEGGFTNGLHRLNQLQMWTKIRPFAHEFIEAASKIFEMYVYTMGERGYAVAMVRLLDPTGRFFGDRIISQGDSTRSTTKDLDVVLGAESAVVILDDTEGVWPKHRANLILMERYHFFRSSCRQFGLKSLSLSERKKDESDEGGTLATALRTLQSVHHRVFNTGIAREAGILKGTSSEYQDVRKVIQSMRGTILKGCRVVFSRIFPTGMPYPEAHPFWRLTEELGAHCATSLSSSTTHIVALDRGTDKARWARQHGKFLVHPSWVVAAQHLWCHPQEKDFPVGENNPDPPTASFAQTVDVVQQNRSVESPNGTVEVSRAELLDGVESRSSDMTDEVKVSQKENMEVSESAKAPDNVGTPAQTITS